MFLEYLEHFSGRWEASTQRVASIENVFQSSNCFGVSHIGVHDQMGAHRHIRNRDCQSGKVPTDKINF